MEKVLKSTPNLAYKISSLEVRSAFTAKMLPRIKYWGKSLKNCSSFSNKYTILPIPSCRLRVNIISFQQRIQGVANVSVVHWFFLRQMLPLFSFGHLLKFLWE